MSLVNIPWALKEGLLRVVSYVPGVTSKHLREQLESCIIRPREPDKADIILAEYRDQINSTPALLSLLYDTNMLPEQTVTVHGAICVAAICEAYNAGQAHGETLLTGRDQFIVDNGLWEKFIDSLPKPGKT